MKARRFWGNVSQKTTLLFLITAVLSVFALIWMGQRLIQQDRALEAQQLEERREAAADRTVTALEQLLATEERKLDDPEGQDVSPFAEDIVHVFWDSEKIRAWPENALLYYPFVPGSEGSSPGTQLFQGVEREEFQNNDYSRAINLLGPLTRSKDPGIQAASKLRLARNLRKAGRIDEALAAYEELGSHTAQASLFVSGIPIDLLARSAHCALLDDQKKSKQLQLEAKSLFDDLEDRRWRLDRSSYLYYLGETMKWLESNQNIDRRSQAMAEAVVWLWENVQGVDGAKQSINGRRSLRLHDQPIVVLWNKSNLGFDAIVAGPKYQQSQWYDPLFAGVDFSSVNVCLHDTDGVIIYGQEPSKDVPVSSRSALISGLPWNISLYDANPESDLSQFGQRRQFMFAGLGILALLVIAVSFLISRAVTRELAAARLQADFVSSVSHEFRTPLTSMRQFTEMLIEDDSIPDEKRRTFYQAQARSTNRLSRLVESLLDFGRMEAGARPYRLQPRDAGQLTKAIVEEYRKESGSDASRIGYFVPDEGPFVNADKEALGQALWNLIDNAVKYSKEGQKVHIEVEGNDQVEIKVQDEGLGIPASEKSRILHKFVRGASAKEQGIKGTGIGLAMVKHIVDAHGGDLEIDSEPGKGSTFTIVLPGGGKKHA